MFCATIRAGPFRSIRLRPDGVTAGERAEAAPGRRRGLAAGPAEQERRRAEGVEDQDVGLAVAVHVHHPQGRRHPGQTLQGNAVVLAPAEGEERPRLLTA